MGEGTRKCQSLDREGSKQSPAAGPRSAFLPGRGLGRGVGEGHRGQAFQLQTSGAEAGRVCASWGPAVGGAQCRDASWGRGGRRLPANPGGWDPLASGSCDCYMLLVEKWQF